MDLAAAREALAAAVTGAGIDCTPYTTDNPSPPVGFVDTLSLDYQTPAGFCLPSQATASIVTVGQRHDPGAAMQLLESLVGPVVDALQAIPGLRLLAVDTGTATVGKNELPAVSYTVAFAVGQ